MPTLPNNEIYNSGEIITTVMEKLMVPNLMLTKTIPFTDAPKKYIVAQRELYSADTDPENMVPSEATTSTLAAWPEVEVTLGDRLSLNTVMRKTKCSFTKDDLRDPMFDSIARTTYGRMAWLMAKQINASLISSIKSNATTTSTVFSAKQGGNWDGAGNPIEDLRHMAQDVSANMGFQLDSVLVHRTNYFEMLDFLEDSDEDLNYYRSETERGFYDAITRLRNPGVTVVGIPDGVGLSEGAIIGLAKFQGGPCIQHFAYRDPDYTFSPLPIDNSDPGIGAVSVPLNVNPWAAPDTRTFNVEAWVDSVPHVAIPKGVIYLASSGI